MSQLLFRSSLVLQCLALISGCTSPPSRAMPPVVPYRGLPSLYKVAQLGFGDTAHFGLCMPPACPLATPKHSVPADQKNKVSAGGTAPVNGNAESAVRERPATTVNVLTIYFATGQSVLDAEARHSIDALVVGMPVRYMQIAAHTDSTGTPAQNGRVARQRAAAVSHYVRAITSLAGVPLDVEAKALCCYVATNADANGRRLNRRVDIALDIGGHEGAP